VRGAFVKTLVELAEQDPRILLLTGDLGYNALEPFAEKFPDRFFNVGVAEQNMVGLATGLAESGFIPYVYSITNFAVLRPYEFIRNGPVLHQFPVRIVGVGGGFEYGSNGLSHHGLEDIGIMRIQPGITVIAPADHQQAYQAFLKTWNLPGPVYYRIGKDDQTVVAGLEGHFELGRAQSVREGSDLLIIAMGSVANEAVAAAQALSLQGISSAAMVIASISPPPVEDLSVSLGRFRLVLTVEAHYVAGGLGSLISEIVAERGLCCRVIRCGVEALPHGISGGQRFLHQAHGISAERLVDKALQALYRMKPSDRWKR
jgi:transketolase